VEERRDMNTFMKIINKIFKKNPGRNKWMLKAAQNGDVLLIGCDRFTTNLTSKLLHEGIIKFTGGKWSHSGIIKIIRGETNVIEATSDGVITTPLWRYMTSNGISYNMKIKRVQEEHISQAKKAACNAKKHKGKKYDYVAVINLAGYILYTKQKRKGLSLPNAEDIFGRNTPDLFICSELVHAAYREAGICLCDFVEDPDEQEALVTPRDLDESKYLHDVRKPK